MPQPEQFDVVILGSGTAGKLMAWHMAGSGTTDRRRGAQLGRRLLSQHRLHAEQERDLERRGRASGAARRAIRRDDRPRQGRHGDGSPAKAGHGRSAGRQAFAELQEERRRIDHGERAFCRAENARGEPQRRRDAHARGRPGLPRPRNARCNSRRSRPRGREAADPYRGAGARLLCRRI